MSQLAAVRAHLQGRFEQERVVVWHDPDGSYVDELDDLTPDGVTILRVVNDEFVLKHRVLREDLSSKFLLYRSGQIPTGTSNWLLDVELSHGVFAADRSALLRADIGLTASGMDELVVDHAKFFGNSKATLKLKALLNDEDDLTTVRAKMSAVLLGQREHSFSELTRTLLVQHADDDTSGIDALAAHRLTDFYWRGAKQIYGYAVEAPTVAGFVFWMFRQAQGGFAPSTSNTARNMEIDFRSFRDSRQSEKAIKALARLAESDLDYADQVTTLSFTDLTSVDTFDAGDKEIVRRLVEGISSQTLSGRDISETIRTRRRESVWFEDYETLYAALAAAAELIPAGFRLPRLDVSSFEDGLTKYKHDLFRIDQLYRQYTFAAQNAEFKATPGNAQRSG